MSIATAAPRFALIATGILMVVLAAVASVMTTPAVADAKTSETVISVAAVTTLSSGATATGSIGTLG